MRNQVYPVEKKIFFLNPVADLFILFSKLIMFLKTGEAIFSFWILHAATYKCSAKNESSKQYYHSSSFTFKEEKK